MMSREDNDLLTQVGPDAPMGKLLRRFWTPALLEEELPGPDCDPVRLRLFGEDLVAFRDTDGKVGVLDAYCPHRLAHLYFGRNEECGLRCVYHGWKFDVDGNCVDMPSEPEGERLKKNIKAISYPARLRGGVIWVYMGPKDKMPALPEFEWFRLPASQRTAIKRVQRCNWAQAVEGGIDSAHISFLHRRIDGLSISSQGKAYPSWALNDTHPVFDVRDSDHGLTIGARRSAEEHGYYWRITQALMPFYQMIPPPVEGFDSRAENYSGHAWVPIDDETTWTWSFSAQPHRDFTEKELAFHGGKAGTWGPVDDHFEPLRNQDNDYLLDRQAQRMKLFAGIEGIPNQDAAVQESMGKIADRRKEHLGSSDSAVIAWRRKVMKLARDLEKGIDPEIAQNAAAYNVRSASLVLPKDVDFVEGAAWLTHGGPIAHAAE